MTGNSMEIGGVRLHLERYDSSFQYSDGDVEEELLEIVKSTADLDGVLQSTGKWPLLYHLHSDRQNILSWYPFTGAERALEVGAGCGAVTAALARRCAHVDCNDISLRRSQINAYRNAQYGNIDIHVCNFTDLQPEQPYDVITLIGVFEYAAGYVRESDPYRAMLERVKQMLSPDGKLFIAIENKLGLKYWAGCREDHTGRYFEGLEGYPTSGGVKTFSRNGLEQVLQSAGFRAEFHYPVPDYKFAYQIYSDGRLPTRGELRGLRHNMDADRLKGFDEDKVFNELIGEGLFPLFANSFLVVAERG